MKMVSPSEKKSMHTMQGLGLDLETPSMDRLRLSWKKKHSKERKNGGKFGRWREVLKFIPKSLKTFALLFDHYNFF